MLQGRGAHEIGLASAAVPIQLLQRLIERKLLPREQVIALLGDAADELEDPRQATDAHLLAAQTTRNELERFKRRLLWRGHPKPEEVTPRRLSAGHGG